MMLSHEECRMLNRLADHRNEFVMHMLNRLAHSGWLFHFRLWLAKGHGFLFINWVVLFEEMRNENEAQ